MKLDKKILYYGIGSIVLSLLACIGLTFYMKLDQPVFLRYCMEVPAKFSETINYYEPVMQLEYITNSNDKRTVTGISFAEAPDIYFNATENRPGFTTFQAFNGSSNTSLGNIMGRYSIRTVFVYMTIDIFQDGMTKDIELGKAQIHFSNGDTLDTDLGRVILYNESDGAKSLPGGGYSSNSTNDKQITSFRMAEDITLSGMESVLVDLAGDTLNLEVNDTKYNEIEGIEITKGSRVEISSQFTA